MFAILTYFRYVRKLSGIFEVLTAFASFAVFLILV